MKHESSTMKILALMILFYGILIFIGGLMGHIKAASHASLISGIVFGSLLLINSLILFKNKKFGVYLAFFLTFVLDAFFTYRFCLTQKFMPAGMMSVVSLLMLLLMAYVIKRKEKLLTGAKK